MEKNSQRTFLIVGLGNPGREYRESRHNIGFMVLDRLASSFDLSFSRKQADALVTDRKLEETRILLAKPQTYMNRSGKSVSELLRYYRIDLSDCLVIYDDLDLPLGSIRIRAEGGSGGHKGMKSIISTLGSIEVPRMRLGIGRPPGTTDPAVFVLRKFSESEEDLVKITLIQATECIELFLHAGIDSAMNKCNPSVSD